MNDSVEISLSVNSKLGLLRVTFSNHGETDITLRHVFEPDDVVIENESGERAEYYLSFPYGADVETFRLGSRKQKSFDINLANDFVYPSSGKYQAWVEYDTTRTTAKYAKSELEPVALTSNKVRFPIELPSPSV